MVTVILGTGRNADLLPEDFPTVGALAAAAAEEAALEPGANYSLKVDGSVAPPARPSSSIGEESVVELVDVTGYEHNFPVELDSITVDDE